MLEPQRIISATIMPRELEIALNAPIGPHRLADDTIVTEQNGWYRTLTPSSTWPGSNEVLFSNLNSEHPDRQLEQTIAEYHSRNLPVTWCVYPWTQPAGLGSQLISMGANSSRIRAFLTNTEHALERVEGVDVHRVDADDDVAFNAFFEIMTAVYVLPAAEEAFRRYRYRELSRGSAPQMQLHVAYCKEVLAGCHATVINEDSGHFTGGCVLPQFRAHGVFQSMLAVSLKALRDMGIRLATGHSNEKSAFWVDRFGFQTIYLYDIYQLDPPVRRA